MESVDSARTCAQAALASLGFRDREASRDLQNIAARLVRGLKDDDFLQHSAVHGHPPKVVLIRVGNCSTAQMMELLRSSQSDLDAFADDETSSVLVLR